MNNRLLYIDYVRAFSILFVVLHHSQLPDPYSSIAYFLCLPAFFAVSGYLKKDVPLGVFVHNRIRRLIVPYFIFGLVAYCIWLFSRHYGKDAADVMIWWQPLAGLLYGSNNGWLVQNPPLWFLTCLFSVELLYAIICKYVKNLYWHWGIVLLIWIAGWINSVFNPILLPWGLGAAMIMLPLYAAANFLKKIDLCINSWIYVTMSILVPILGCVSYMLNPKIQISKDCFGNMPIFMIGVFSVAALWIITGKWLEKVPYRFKMLEIIGSNTLTILCLHMPVFTIIKGITFFLLHAPLSIYETVWGSLLLFAGSFVIVLPTCLFLKRYVPWLVGR